MTNKFIILAVLALASCKPKTPPVNYQSQIDSLNGVIEIQDRIIDNMVNDLDSLIELKEQVRYVQGKKIIEYRSITTPQRVQQLAERL
jgi:aspartate carbamoyltransferase regulatory subunit